MNMTSLGSLGLSPSIVAKLTNADFLQDSDLLHLKPSELSSATNLTIKECTEVIRLASSKPSELLSQVTNLKEVVQKDASVDYIVTFCESLDDLLGGGILLKTITEVSGTPGIGKTQLCLQLCISAQVLESMGGVEGEAVYIDTEGSFNVLRLKEMAESAENHMKQVHKSDSSLTFNTENILKGVYYFRCHNHLELLAVIKHLHSFLEEHKKVRLIVIDSIAFHFRHDFTDMIARTSLLCSITQDLIQQASTNNLAVVVTNQMTTKVESQGCSQVVAALGDSWGHCPTVRVLLHWSGNLRMASIVKAPHVPKASVYFQVTSGGVRDKRMEAGASDKSRKRKFCEELL